MTAQTLCSVTSFLIAHRASRETGASPTLKCVLMVEPTFLVVQHQRFNDCANIVHRQQFCQIAEAIAFRSSHSGGGTFGRVLNTDRANVLGCAPSSF